MSLRHRSVESDKSAFYAGNESFLEFPRSTVGARRKLEKAAAWTIESLERRLLLTTMMGGGVVVDPATGATHVTNDQLLFVNEDGNVQSIQLFGNITAEVIGANVNAHNQVELENLPGRLNGADYLGGFNLTPGATLVGNITYDAPTVKPQLRAIAVNPNTGAMFGFAVDTMTMNATPPATGTVTVSLVYLVQFTQTAGAFTGAAHIITEISQQVLMGAGAVGGTVTSIPGAAFDPNTGLLYFDAVTMPQAMNGGAGGGTASETLFTIDPNSLNVANSVNAITPGNFGNAPNSNNPRTDITGLNFNNGALTGSAGATAFTIDPLNSANLTGITAENVNNSTINGLANGSPTTAIPNGPRFFVTSKGEVYYDDPQFGALDYGALSTDPNVKLGQNPGDLTFDPFDSNLYSVDTGTNQLFIVSQQDRTRDLSIFQIYVSQSDPTGEIVTTQFQDPRTTNNPHTIPYGAGINGGVRMTNAQNGQTIVVAAPGASGDALIGARTHTITGQQNVDLIPTFTQTLAPIPSTTLSPFTSAPYTVGQTLTAGIVAAQGTQIGKIMDSGPIMGEIHLLGSVDTIYAGWLLTGNADGETAQDVVSDPANVSIAGDIRNLYVQTSAGTNTDTALNKPTYVTGFDMLVGGTIGNVQAFDSIVGNIFAQNSASAPSLTTAQSETEVIDNMNPWDTGVLAGNAIFQNDTFATPQVLGAIPTTLGGTPDAVVVNGVLDDGPPANDFVDYYGVPLMAGQTITCQLTAALAGELDVAIFNPDGDLVASDYSAVDLTQTQNLPFRYTTDRPGIWRFAVASNGNLNFTPADNNLLTGPVAYTLTITGVGDLAVGQIAATNNILDNVNALNPGPSFGTQVGDFGAISAGGAYLSGNVGDSISVPDGNLRVINAGTVGFDNAAEFDPQISVPNGSVGLVFSTTGILVLNDEGATVGPDGLLVPLTPPIGGDYQLISSTGNLQGQFIADGSIGVIRAASIVPVVGGFADNPSFFTVNAANSTVKIGHIDLIDVTGNVGNLAGGGPHIRTGTQGNVGYFRVGGTVFDDSSFDVSGGTVTLFQPGESATLTDDSGATVVITPTGTPSVPPTVGVSNTTGGTTVNPTLPQLSVQTYGIEGSGGVAILNVTSTGGVTITSSGDLPGQSVQIGEIDALGLGQGLVSTLGRATTTTQPQQPTATGGTTTGGTTTGGTTTTTAPTFFTGPDTAGPVGRTLPLALPPELNPNSETPLNVILQGTAQIGTFEVFGGFISTIANTTTGGEIVNTIVESIGNLISKGTIGLTQNHTGCALNGEAVVANTFPLIDDHNAIQEVAPLPMRGFPLWGITNFTPSLGPVPATVTTFTTVLASGTTTTQTITPVAVGATLLGIAVIQAGIGLGNLDVTAGNVGSIQGSILGPCFVSGQINNVVLGSGGIASSGTGAGSQAGIYALGQIGVVSNALPCDIRGSIVSTTGITGVDLKNGSIINGSIMDVTALNMSIQLPIVVVISPEMTPITNPVFDVGNIIVDGNGGIIGSQIIGDHIGHVDVHRGFGIFDTVLGGLGDATLAGILADGYGIRGTVDPGGASIGSIVATGHGQNISTQVYSSSVRFSETNTFDPSTGFAPNLLTDIDVSLGATAAMPQVPTSDTGGTDAGVIQDCTFTGSRNLGSVRAWRIRATDPTTALTIFDFANSIGSITTASNINGMSLITGKLGSFRPSGDISNLKFQIAGPIKNLIINGNVLGTSTIAATGKNGSIGSLRILGNMQGSITANRRINSALIGGNLSGLVSAQQVNSLKVGSLTGGNLDIQGSVGVFQTTGDLGLPSETLTIHGSAKAIRIGGNLNANIVVQGNLGTLQVGQSVLGGTTTHIVNTLGLLSVDGDVQAGATITAALIKKQKIKGLVQGTIN